jgi:hypothetical protein
LSSLKNTLEDIYQQFNQNDLNLRTAFELVYNECRKLNMHLQNVNAQLNQLVKEKSEWKKLRDKKRKGI